jgi:ankyrin repeat protein
MMRKDQQILIPLFFALLAIFAQAAIAQTPLSSYGFLEVVDFEDKPVVKATVKSSDYLSQQTNQNGNIESGVQLKYAYFAFNTPSFSITKKGYYTFTDYFDIFKFLGEIGRNNKDKPLKIELLKIPENPTEKKVIGDEQLKREFFIAARTGDLATVHNLIKSGLNPNLTTSELRGVPAPQGVPIIIYAARSGNPETVREFLAAGVDLRKKDEPIRKILLTYLQAIPFQQKYPRTETEKAELIDIFEVGAKSLIKAGADIYATDDYQTTPLMIATENGYFQTVKLLLDKGVSINAKNFEGLNALMLLARNERKLKPRIEIAELLIDRGIKINEITDIGSYEKHNCKTALAFAVESGNMEMIKFLLDSKADVNLTCPGVPTLLEYVKKYTVSADKETTQKIIELLEKAGAK